MIPRELVKKLRKIEIHTARLANDQLAGGYHSVFKGRGMAFAEVRQYQPGDDVRFIDWNVSARMNDTYVKVFTEEREMTVMLVVDLSASERFGSVALAEGDRAEVAARSRSARSRTTTACLIVHGPHRDLRAAQEGQGHVMRVIAGDPGAKPVGTGTDQRSRSTLLGSVARRRSVAFRERLHRDERYEFAACASPPRSTI